MVRMCAPIQMRDASSAYVVSQRGTFQTTNGLLLVEEMVVGC